MRWAASTKSRFFATKSVSLLSSTSAEPEAATSPAEAVRSCPRFFILSWPLTRRTSAALSKSPSASLRAFLQSIIPAPVRSRSRLTSAAEIAMESPYECVCWRTDERASGVRGPGWCRLARGARLGALRRGTGRLSGRRLLGAGVTAGGRDRSLVRLSGQELALPLRQGLLRTEL